MQAIRTFLSAEHLFQKKLQRGASILSPFPYAKTSRKMQFWSASMLVTFTFLALSLPFFYRKA